MSTRTEELRKVSKQCTHESMQELGAWVYSGIGVDSIFKRFNSIAEAVNVAIDYENAHVLHNGVEVDYGSISEDVMYYRCINTGELVILKRE